MSKAGSALMGIGRANGENRAVTAAQQAIESPLLEVSIDGARGVLFNVIGGNDLAMHEINAAAETITAAADPEANIIFGATIQPELEGEVIITVVATGFDASYYAKRDAKPSSSKAAAPAAEPKLPSVETTSKQDEKALSEIDMNLDDENQEKAHDFSQHDVTMPNIWSMHDEDNGQEGKSLLDAAESDKDKDEDQAADAPDVVSSSLENDLEKPSFLRRLGRRRKEQDDEHAIVEDEDNDKK
jgi:cell division protein FtsZ